MKKAVCYVGGETLGNPGQAVTGVYITDESNAVVKELTKSIGNANLSFAVYYSVMMGLQTLESLYGNTTNEMSFEMCLDNEQVKKQLNAELPLNEPGLVPMFMEIHNMIVTSFPNLVFRLLKKEENQQVNRLLKEALDVKS